LLLAKHLLVAAQNFLLSGNQNLPGYRSSQQQ
jgi:hypothetical protein